MSEDAEKEADGHAEGQAAAAPSKATPPPQEREFGEAAGLFSAPVTTKRRMVPFLPTIIEEPEGWDEEEKAAEEEEEERRRLEQEDDERRKKVANASRSGFKMSEEIRDILHEIETKKEEEQQAREEREKAKAQAAESASPSSSGFPGVDEEAPRERFFLAFDDIEKDLDPDLFKLFHQRKESVPEFLAAIVDLLNSVRLVDRHFALRYLGVVVLRNAERVRLFNQAKGLEPLLRCVKTNDISQEYSAMACVPLIFEEEARKALMSKGGFAALLRHSRKSKPLITERCTFAISLLASFPEAAARIAEDAGIDTLLMTSRTAAESAQQHAGAALALLARSNENQSILVHKGGFDVIERVILNGPGSRTAYWYSAALVNMAKNPMNVRHFKQAEAQEVIHVMASSPDDGVRKNAAWLLLFISLQRWGAAPPPGMMPAIIRDALQLSVSRDERTLQLIQMTFANFVGSDKVKWQDTRRVREYKETVNSQQELVQASAAAALDRLTEENPKQVIETLVDLSCSPETAVAADALWVLSNLLMNQWSFPLVLQYGGLTPLILFTGHKNEAVQLLCARTLVKIALDRAVLLQVKDMNPIMGLLLLCDSRDVDVRRSAMVCLWIASIMGRDTQEMSEEIVASCFPSIPPSNLLDTIRKEIDRKANEFRSSRSRCTRICPCEPIEGGEGGTAGEWDEGRVGIECLCALSRNAGFAVQGSVAFKVREAMCQLVRRSSLKDGNVEALIRAMTAMQSTTVEHVKTSIIDSYATILRQAAAADVQRDDPPAPLQHSSTLQLSRGRSQRLDAHILEVGGDPSLLGGGEQMQTWASVVEELPEYVLISGRALVDFMSREETSPDIRASCIRVIRDTARSRRLRAFFGSAQIMPRILKTFDSGGLKDPSDLYNFFCFALGDSVHTSMLSSKDYEGVIIQILQEVVEALSPICRTFQDGGDAPAPGDGHEGAFNPLSQAQARMSIASDISGSIDREMEREREREREREKDIKHWMSLEIATRILTPYDVEEVPEVVFSLSFLLMRCASLPFVQTLLIRRAFLLAMFIKTGLRCSSLSLLARSFRAFQAITVHLSPEKYAAMEQHVPNLLDFTLQAVDWCLNDKEPNKDKDTERQREDLAKDMFEERSSSRTLLLACLEVLSSLALMGQVRDMLPHESYLAAVEATWQLPDVPDVLFSTTLLFLNRCCRSKEHLRSIATPSRIKSIIRLVQGRRSRKTEEHDMLLTEVATLLYNSTKLPQSLTALTQLPAAIDTLCMLAKSGPAIAQKDAVKALYTLCTFEEMKRTMVRKGLVESLCANALEGEESVQAHAAWLLSSMLVRGEDKRFLYDRKTLRQLTGLLNSKNPKVLYQASWALNQLPIEDDIISKLMEGEGRFIPLLAGTLANKDPSVASQACHTMAHLAKSKEFLAALPQSSAFDLMLKLLSSEETEVQVGVSKAMESLAAVTNAEKGDKASKAKLAHALFDSPQVAPGVVSLLSSSDQKVREAALSALVALLRMPKMQEPLLRADVMRVMFTRYTATETEADKHAGGGVGSPAGTNASPSPADEGASSREGQANSPAVGFEDWSSSECVSLATAARLFCMRDEACEEFLKHGGLGFLMELAKSTNPAVLVQVAWTLGVLAADPKTEILAVEAGALEVLQNFSRVPHESVQQRALWAMKLFSVEASNYWNLLRQRLNSGEEQRQDSPHRSLKDRERDREREGGGGGFDRDGQLEGGNWPSSPPGARLNASPRRGVVRAQAGVGGAGVDRRMTGQLLRERALRFPLVPHELRDGNEGDDIQTPSRSPTRHSAASRAQGGAARGGVSPERPSPPRQQGGNGRRGRRGLRFDFGRQKEGEGPRTSLETSQATHAAAMKELHELIELLRPKQVTEEEDDAKKKKGNEPCKKTPAFLSLGPQLTQKFNTSRRD